MNGNILGSSQSTAVLDALRVCIELGAQNPPGDLMLATSCSWRRILVGPLQLPFLVPSIDSDRHPNLECGAQFAHAEESIACTNLIRQHGPALEQSLRSLADENQALLREREWQPIESAPAVDGEYFWCRLAWGPEEDPSTGEGFRWKGTWFATGCFHHPGQSRKFGYREIEVQPTHWMPLPAGPNGANGDVETLRVEQPTGDSP